MRSPPDPLSPSLRASAAAWALELVGVPSVNGTADEARFAEWLRARLAGLPAFAEGAGAVWTIPVPGDPLGRSSVAALARGRGEATVVLTGHFDTVRFDNYGRLAPLAMKPEALGPALAAQLAAEARTAAERRALADLQGGAFLPGRGLLDMKSGLAAALAVVQAFAADPDREGNLLFLAVPDEEANSAGARSAARALAEIARRFGLSYAAAINLDALVDEGDGDAGRSVALGTVGKLLPSVLVVGRAVHAANALQGLNAGALAARIVAAMEWSAGLAEQVHGERSAPPTLLGLKDNRAGYDVTTPDRVWAYWNVMVQRRSPQDVLAAVADLCRAAAAETLQALQAQSRSLGAGTNLPPAVPVLTFQDLKAAVFADDPSAAARFAELGRALAGRGLDLPEQCRLLTDHLWTASRRPGPTVIVGFASMPYLPTRLAGPAGNRLEAATRAAASAVAERHGTSIRVIRTFPGISDMSFLGQADPASVPFIAANTPAWGLGIDWPEGDAFGGLPIINAGPWGRDYHTPLERLHTPYAFEVLPELLRDIVRRVLAPPATGTGRVIGPGDTRDGA